MLRLRLSLGTLGLLLVIFALCLALLIQRRREAELRSELTRTRAEFAQAQRWAETYRARVMANAEKEAEMIEAMLRELPESAQ